MARRNPKGSREIAVFNLTEGAETPQIVEEGQAIVLSHESRHMDRIRDLIDSWDDGTTERRLEIDWVLGYFYEGLSYRDMSRRYGYSHEHIRRTIHRILAEMRERLEEDYEWDDTVE